MRNLFTLAFIFFSSMAWAMSQEQMDAVQANLEERITPIVHGFDPNAIVYVKLKTKVSYIAQIEIPYLLESLPPKEIVSVSRVDINIVTEKNLPDSLLSIIKEVASTRGLSVAINPVPMPKDLSKTEPPPPEEQGWFSFTNAKASVPTTLFICTLLLVTAFGYLFLRIANKTEAVYHGIEQVADALESPETTDGQLTVKLPVDEGLAALIADCYWGKFDAYAAFLWKKIEPEKQIAILKARPFLREYTLWLSDTTGTDFGVRDESYYQKPLNIDHLDSEKLTQLVRRTPHLFVKLSSLRRSSLSLSTTEKVELMKLAFGPTSDVVPKFETMPPSTLRQLPKRFKLRVDSVASELEIMRLQEVSINLVEGLPSLSWWYRLPIEDLKEALSHFRAKEIASAWIGPEQVLARFQEALPRQKLYLVKAYLNRITPSRDSKTFRALHEAAVTCLRNKAANELYPPNDEHHHVRKAA